MKGQVFPRVTRRGAALDWVKFDAELARDGSVDTVDKALYAAIASFVDADTRESPETGEVDPNNIPPWVPTRKRLAECIGKSLDTVDRATKRLEARRLLKVHRQPDPTNPKRMLPSEYELLDHHIWDERAAQRVADRAARSGGGRIGAATPGRVDAATPGRTGAAVKDLGEVVEEEGGELALAARSAGDARRAGAGSSSRVSDSGSAAAGKAGSSSVREGGKARVPGQRDEATELAEIQAAVCREVEAGLPAELVALLPYGHIPKRTRQAVLDALNSRTPQQLAQRAARRWLTYRYEVALRDGELTSPVGVALELIAPTPYCPEPSCEDGIEDGHLGGTQECQLCVTRRRDRRQARAKGLPVQEGRSKGRRAEPIECADCGRPFPGKVPDGAVCDRCTEEAAAALQALAARFRAKDEAAEAERQRAADLAAEADREHQEATERLKAEAAARAAAEQEAAAAADEETARLRAQMLAENPWMAKYAAKPKVQEAAAPF